MILKRVSHIISVWFRPPTCLQVCAVREGKLKIAHAFNIFLLDYMHKHVSNVASRMHQIAASAS